MPLLRLLISNIAPRLVSSAMGPGCVKSPEQISKRALTRNLTKFVVGKALK